MRKKLIARTAKLQTEPKKGRKNKGIAVTYEHCPLDLDERNHGTIYAVININCQDKEAEEVAELIIDAFHGEYYSNLERDPLASLEASLTKINEELAEITHQGKTGWLKNLNALLAVLSGTTLHVTKSGKAEAYLYRGEKSSHISNDLAGDQVNPLRTFINIATGDLVEKDKISLVTPGVFFHLSKDELKKYVIDFQPRVAISHLADLLEGGPEVNPNALLILEAITPEAASNETLEDQPDEVWISEPKKPLKSAVNASSPFIKKLFAILLMAFGTIYAFFKTKFIPSVLAISKNLSLGLKNLSKNKPNKTNEGDIFVDTEESLAKEEISSPDLDSDLTEDEDKEIEPLREIKSTGQEIFIKETPEKPKRLNLEMVNISAAKNLGRKLNKSYTKLTQKRSRLLAAAAIVLLLVGGGLFIAWQGRDNQDNLREAQTILDEAKSKYQGGETAVANGKNREAADLLREAEKLLQDILNDKKISGEAASLLDQVQVLLDKAEGVVRITPVELANVTDLVGKEAFGPYQIKNKLYLINRDNSTVVAVSIDTGEASIILDKPKISGKTLTATAIPNRSVLALLTDNGSFYEIDTVDIDLNEQTVSGDIEKGQSMISYLTNIYTLEPASGKVYKRLKTSSGYNRRTEYITDGSTVSDGVGIATDSHIYTLSKNGEIHKYLAGKKLNFAITNLPFTIDGAIAIYANEDVGNLIVLEPTKNRLIIFDQNGRFLSQQVSDKIKSQAGLFLNQDTSYLYSDGIVYKITL